MKRFLTIIVCLLCLLSFSACGKEQMASAESLETNVAYELSNIENFDNLSTETQKALAVAVRTKLKTQTHSKLPKNSILNQNATKIVNLTKGEVLDINEEEKQNINISNNILQENWKKKISKSDVLRVCNELDISLASIKNIEPHYDEDKKLLGLSVGGKDIPFSTLQEKFKLESNEVTNVSSSLTNITISGKKPKPKGYFDITEAENLAGSGASYKQLLNHFYPKNTQN